MLILTVAEFEDRWVLGRAPSEHVEIGGSAFVALRFAFGTERRRNQNLPLRRSQFAWKSRRDNPCTTRQLKTGRRRDGLFLLGSARNVRRSEEHTSELQSLRHL